jgi:putative ABC transport system permease protein
MFLLRRGQMDRDLAEEMRQHAALKAEKNIAYGMAPDEAQHAAQRQIGNVTRQMEESRQSWGFPAVESVWQDIRYGLRGLRKSPGFTTIAMLTLALGIGASTAIFSIVNTVLLRPLPYKDSSRLVHVWTVSSMFPEFTLGQSIPNLQDIEARSHSFETLATFEVRARNLTGSGEPEQLRTVEVSPSFLTLFGVHPIIGRDFRPEDEQRKDGDVVLLSYGLWQRRFGGDRSIIGRTIMLSQQPWTVAGVLPSGFSFPGNIDALVPRNIPPGNRTERQAWMYTALGKLRPGVSLAKAQSEMNGIAAALAHQYPQDATGIQFPLVTLQDDATRRSKPQLLALLGAVGFLLLIACANVSNLVLSRGLRRQREIAVRAALGASRRRILRQLLIESLLLAMAGGVAGAGLAIAGVRLFRALAPAGFPRIEELRTEPVTLLIALIVSALAGILCGLAPALTITRGDLNLPIRDNSAASSAPVRLFSLRSFLVVAEVALALVLLTGSALMAQSMMRLLRVDTGLTTDHLLTGEMTLPKALYDSKDSQHLFLERLLQALQARRQFSGAVLTNSPLLTGSVTVTSFNPALLGSTEKKTTIEIRSVTPDYFSTLGIRIQRGRIFNERDTAGALSVALINEAMARRFFPGQDPLGKPLKFDADDKTPSQIVGVVADTRDSGLNAPPRLQAYFPLLQNPSERVYILVRSSLDPAAAIAEVQRTVWSVDKDLPLSKTRTMGEVISESVAEPRFRTWLVSIFAIAGLTLTLIGIYGVISYSVRQRTREMGIRIALGAQSGSLLGLVLRQAVVLTVTGAVIGIIGSLLLMRLLASQLFEIKPGDPVTLIGAVLLMMIVAVAASWVPARRATKVDPMIALRYE